MLARLAPPCADAGKVEHNPSEKNKTCFNMPDFLFLLGWIVTVIIMLWVAFFYGVTKLEDAYHTYRTQVQVSLAFLSCAPLVIFAVCVWRHRGLA